MTAWCKIGLILAAVIAVFFAGYHTKGKFDQAAQEAVLEAQIKANTATQAKIEARATTAEAQLAGERKKTATLNHQWETARVEKNHTVCTYSPATLSLLRAATSAKRVVSR